VLFSFSRVQSALPRASFSVFDFGVFLGSWRRSGVFHRRPLFCSIFHLPLLGLVLGFRCVSAPARSARQWLLRSDFGSCAASSSFRFCLSVPSACRRCLLLESQDFPVLVFLWSPSVRNSVRSYNFISHRPDFVS
jgi:hypothetical protein